MSFCSNNSQQITFSDSTFGLTERELRRLKGGVRNGELGGLEWTDIDFKNNVITIRRTSQYCKGYGMLTKEPKNATNALLNYLQKFLRY